MNIMIPVLSEGRGGLEMYTLDLADEMLARGHHVNMVTKQGSFTDRKRREQNIPGQSVDGWQYVDPFLLKRLLAMVDEHETDVIHSHKSQDIWYGSYLTWLRTDITHLFTQHMRPGEKNDFFHRVIYKGLDRFIVISDDVGRAVQKNCPVNEDRITKLYYGIDLRKFTLNSDDENSDGVFSNQSQAGDSPLTIGLVGRIDPVKRHDVFLQAAKHLLERGLEAEFWIVGDIVDEKDREFKRNLVEYVEENDLKNAVKFLGHVDNVLEVYRKLDINCMTTDREHFGKVIQETQAMQVPVVASSGGGAPEAMDPGETGLLFEPGDAKDLAAQLQTLIEQPSLRGEMAKKGREYVKETFDWEQHFDRLEEMYRCVD